MRYSYWKSHERCSVVEPPVGRFTQKLLKTNLCQGIAEFKPLFNSVHYYSCRALHSVHYILCNYIPCFIFIIYFRALCRSCDRAFTTFLTHTDRHSDITTDYFLKQSNCITWGNLTYLYYKIKVLDSKKKFDFRFSTEIYVLESNFLY